MSSFRMYVVISILAICAYLALPQSIWGAGEHSLRVGVSKLDISPKDLAGLISVTNKPFQSVREPIYVRALVLDDGSTTAAIVAIDFVEFGNTMPLRGRIARELGIPADHIMIAASHDHSAPRGGPPTPGTSSVQGRPKTTPAYAQQTDDTIVEALREAKASLAPARMGVGTGRADVNVYRYAYTPTGWRAGVNPDGVSDKTVWVVKFENLSGEPIALLMNYAVHSNVAIGEHESDDKIMGDIAGTTERYVESHYQDKIVALWTLGAAADQYPKFNKEVDQTWATTPADQLIEIQGKILGMEVIQTASRIGQMTPVARIQAAERAVPCQMNVPAGGPSAGPGGGPSGPPQPQQPGATLDLHLGLIRINEIAITSVSGEVATNIYSRLRKESPFNDTIMVTLANDRVGYIPDEANWERMSAAFKRGCAENAIVTNLVEMMKGSMQ